MNGFYALKALTKNSPRSFEVRNPYQQLNGEYLDLMHKSENSQLVEIAEKVRSVAG